MQAPRFVLQILTAVCAAACTASAQPTPGTPVDAAQAKMLLESSQLANKAWGAYSTGQLHNQTLQQTLIEQLHWAESLRDSAAYGDGYACIQSLLDALIQLGAAVPTQAILPYAARWRTEALILLAAKPADAGTEAALLAMRDENLNDAEWLAVSNLLRRQRSAAFFRKTLQEIHITHTFIVSDTGATPGQGIGGSFGQGARSVAFPKGFPPTGVYQLEINQFMGGRPPGADDVLVIGGPLLGGPRFDRAMRGDVFYRRVIVPAGGQANIPNRNFRDTDRQMYRRAYMADLGGLPVDQGDALFCATTDVRWESSEVFVRETRQAMASQAKRISNFLRDAGRNGLGDVSGVKLTINAAIQDRRVSRTAQSPIPSIGPKEINLD